MGTGIGHYIPTIAYLGFWVMAVVAIFSKPIYGFYYILPFLPYRTMQDHFQGLPLATNLVTILLICVLIGAFFKGKRPPSSKLYVTWFLFVLYLYFSMWIGTAMGNEPPPLWLSDLNFVGWKDYIVLPLLFLAAGMVIEDRQHVRNVILIVAVALFLVDRSALAESLSHSWAAFDESKRTSGPIAYGPNQLAAFLAQFGMFFWGVARILKRPRVKLVLYSLVGMTLLTNLYTFSRAAYIAVLVSAFFLALVKDRKLIIVLVVFMFTWQVLLPTAVTERVSMTHNSDGKLDESAQERVDLWTQSRDIFLRSPIFGAGFSSFQYGDHTDNLKDTHNYFVKVLVETGVIGFVFFVALLIQLIVAGYRLFRKAEDPLYKALGLGFFLAMISCTIANMFGDRWTYVEINGLLWALAGAVLRADALSTVTDAKQPMAYSGNRLGLPPRRQLAQ